jgi:mRNA-degrading endonuclease RelE of RelBE toxin-antitoxin system
MFSVELTRQANNFLKSLRVKVDLKRIYHKIDELEKDPFPRDAKRVVGYDDPKVFRVRVGNYCVLYFVNYSENKVYIEKIDKRENVYDF